MSSLFWIVLALFLLALAAGLIRKLRKDPCLAFFEGSYVSYLGGRDGGALWGSMRFAPYVRDRSIGSATALDLRFRRARSNSSKPPPA